MRTTADSQLVTVHGTGISVDRRRQELPIAEVRHRFGGLDESSVLGGAIAGVGTAVVLGTAAAAALTGIYRQGWFGQGVLSVIGLATALAVALLAGLTAGWVAGRVSRYDCGRNGLLAGLLSDVLAAAVIATVASQDQLFRTESLPGWVRNDSSGYKALLVGLIALVAVPLLAAAAGGWGGRWHRKADDLLLGTRDGGVAIPGATIHETSLDHGSSSTAALDNPYPTEVR